jgi:hypothetical protein
MFRYFLKRAQGSAPPAKAKMIEEKRITRRALRWRAHKTKKPAPAGLHYLRGRLQIRIAGRPGGMMGGPGGVRRGSIAGAGDSLWNGLMMIGGTVGGADGGPLGPQYLFSSVVNCMASPCDRAGCQYRQRIAIYKAKSASQRSTVRRLPCTLTTQKMQPVAIRWRPVSGARTVQSS